MVNWMDGLKKIQEGGASNKDKEGMEHKRGGVNAGLGKETIENSKRLPINFPYRGQEQHGVAATIPPYVVAPDEWDYYSPEQIAPTHIPDPIRVEIVQDGPREWHAFRAYQNTVNNQASMVASRQERRNKLTIKNLSLTTTIYIGSTANVSMLEGYPLAPGEKYEFQRVEQEVWSIVSSAGPDAQVAIALMAEVVIVEPN